VKKHLFSTPKTDQKNLKSIRFSSHLEGEFQLEKTTKKASKTHNKKTSKCTNKTSNYFGFFIQ
jgi:hypothetical protein